MGRLADLFAGKGSLAGKLKAQREALESGDPSLGRPVVGGEVGDAATAYQSLPVDNVTDNQKTHYDENDLRPLDTLGRRD